MEGERPEAGVPGQELWAELSAQVAASQADIVALEARADAANHRASVVDDVTAEHERRLDELDANVELDRRMIEELQAEGILAKEHAEHMEEALRSSRKIGAAIGIVMVSHRLNESAAFEVLRRASQRNNRKVRAIAEDIINTGDVGILRQA